MHNSVAATIPAVSVLNLVSPRVTGIKLQVSADVISALEKSPSGPIIMIDSLNGCIDVSATFSFDSSQCAINF